MIAFIRTIHIALAFATLLFVTPLAASDTAKEVLIREQQERIEVMIKKLKHEMNTPDTEHRIWVKSHWQFKCMIGNGTDHPVWLQIWDRQEIIFSEIIPAREDRTLWLGDDRARIYYTFQWKAIGAGRFNWTYKGWTLDSKAAFIANQTLIPWLLEEPEND